jgi:hypothetical protein
VIFVSSIEVSAFLKQELRPFPALFTPLTLERLARTYNTPTMMELHERKLDTNYRS